MSTVALAVGISVSGAFVLMIVSVVVIVCVLNKRHPRKRKTVVRNAKKATASIKRKAEKLKAEKSKSSCCAFCKCRRSEGPFPDPPFGIELEDPASTEITILWNEPKTVNTAVPVLGYRVYKRFKTNPDDWTKVGKVTAEQLEFRITDLIPNTRYVFGVASKGKHGKSTIVETQPTTLKKDPVKPGAPTELDVTTRTSSSLTLSWKPPRKSGYSRIHTYYITMKDCEGILPWTYLTSLQAFDRFMDYKVTGLKPNHQYRFRVNAENVAGLGPHAETITFETTAIEAEPPGRPKGPIKYSKITHNSVTLSWRLPEQDGGKPISGYAVEYKEKDGKRWRKAGVCQAENTRITTSGLHEDIEYVFRVIAINGVGNSKQLIGAKVRTKILEIPLSRRSSRNASRDSSRGRPSVVDAFGGDTTQAPVDIEGETLRKKLDNLDSELEADPFVPKSDFFTYDETNSGNISHRHGENKTLHSQFSPLPAPPSSDSNGKVKKRSGPPEIGAKRRHSDYSPLPLPKSRLYANVRLKPPDESDIESEDEENGSKEGDYSMDENGEKRDKVNPESDFEVPNAVIRYQPTPSNIAYKHTRY